LLDSLLQEKSLEILQTMEAIFHEQEANGF